METHFEYLIGSPGSFCKVSAKTGKINSNRIAAMYTAI
jgi:hypothetical protein